MIGGETRGTEAEELTSHLHAALVLFLDGFSWHLSHVREVPTPVMVSPIFFLSVPCSWVICTKGNIRFVPFSPSPDVFIHISLTGRNLFHQEVYLLHIDSRNNVHESKVSSTG